MAEVVELEGCSVEVFGRRLKTRVIDGFEKGWGGGGGGGGACAGGGGVGGAYEGDGGVDGTCAGGGIGDVIEIGGRHIKVVDCVGEDEDCVEEL